MSNYTRGDYREKRAVEYLESFGYTCWQARGSKGCADLICLIANHPSLLVQVKVGTNVSHEGWNALYTLASNLGARPVVCTCTGNSPHITMHWRLILGLHRPHSQTWPSRPILLSDDEA